MKSPGILPRLAAICYTRPMATQVAQPPELTSPVPVGTYYARWFLRLVPPCLLLPFVVGTGVFFYLLYTSQYILYLFPLTLFAFISICICPVTLYPFMSLRVHSDALAERALWELVRIPFDSVDAIRVAPDNRSCVVRARDDSITVSSFLYPKSEPVIRFLASRFSDRVEPWRSSCACSREAPSETHSSDQ